MAQWYEYASIETARLKGFKKGYEEGFKEFSYLVIKNLLLQTDLSITKIASLTAETEKVVIKIKKSLHVSNKTLT